MDRADSTSSAAGWELSSTSWTRAASALAPSTVVEVQIDVLTVAGCPNLELVRSRLGQALVATGAVATVREILIETAAAAEQAGMRGSPTILIDGRDPFVGEGERGSLSCRLYTADGHVSGAPEVARLVEALRR